VHVSAKDQATGREQSITITGSGTLDKSEIDRMVSEAQAHAEDDRQRRELAEARNAADSLAYQVEKQIADLGDKLSGDDKAALEQGVKDVRAAMDGEDVARIRNATQELNNKMMTVSQRIYESMGAAAQPGGEQPGAGPQAQQQPGGEDVIDADYRES